MGQAVPQVIRPYAKKVFVGKSQHLELYQKQIGNQSSLQSRGVTWVYCGRPISAHVAAFWTI